jgi:hypothetical protein
VIICQRQALKNIEIKKRRKDINKYVLLARLSSFCKDIKELSFMLVKRKIKLKIKPNSDLTIKRKNFLFFLLLVKIILTFFYCNYFGFGLLIGIGLQVVIIFFPF